MPSTPVVVGRRNGLRMQHFESDAFWNALWLNLAFSVFQESSVMTEISDDLMTEGNKGSIIVTWV